MEVSGEALETLFFSEGEDVKTSSEEGGCHCPWAIGRERGSGVEQNLWGGGAEVRFTWSEFLFDMAYMYKFE